MWTATEKLRDNSCLKELTLKTEDQIGDTLMNAYVSYRKCLLVLTGEGSGFKIEPSIKR